MKNNLLKILILFESVLLVTGCNDNKSSSVSSNDGESSFVVNTLETGDDYKSAEFFSALIEHSQATGDRLYEGKRFSVINIVPHDIYDKYGAGLYKVYCLSDDASSSLEPLSIGVYTEYRTNDYEAYLYYGKEIFKVSTSVFQGDEPEMPSLAFTDVDKDGYYEITTAYNMKPVSGECYLTTLNTANLATEATLLYNSYFTFEKEGDEVVLYSKGKSYGAIKLYSKDYEFSKPSYYLNCDDKYSVEITWAEDQNKVPVDYFGLRKFFKINLELMYFGEDFEISGSPYTPWGGYLEFRKDGESTINLSWSSASVDGTIKVTKGFVFKSTTSIVDLWDEKTPNGTYDMIVRFNGASITVENALTVK